jgi:hypothetical protein
MGENTHEIGVDGECFICEIVDVEEGFLARNCRIAAFDEEC